MLSFFPRDVLDEIWDLIESVSEDFPSYSKSLFRNFRFSHKIIIRESFNFLIVA